MITTGGFSYPVLQQCDAAQAGSESSTSLPAEEAVPAILHVLTYFVLLQYPAVA